MGRDSKIEWTTHTFNPWRGCTKVSPGCKHCYAEALSKRNPAVLGDWGDDGTRVVASEPRWREPLAWNREAADRVYREFTLEQRQRGEHLLARPRVFCASLADVFEDRPDLVEPRLRLFELIDATPWLDWLLLTKRPENIDRLWPNHAEEVLSRDHEGELYQIHIESRTKCDGAEGDCCWGSGWLPRMPWPIPGPRYRQNVWLGTSVENQACADARIPHLFGTADLCPVHFLSMEPLLGPVNLYNAFFDPNPHRENWPHERRHLLDWIIVGGESGNGARPMHPDWAMSIRYQCETAGVAFFMKQWGDWSPEHVPGRPLVFLRDDGSRVPTTEFFIPQDRPFQLMSRVGKKEAGRILDGRTWDELPSTYCVG